MLTRRAILLMAASLKVSPLAAQTVPDGAPLRAALLDTLRRLLEMHLDPPVEFAVVDLRARDDFAFAHVTVQRAGGMPIDLRQKFPSPFPAGAAANDAMAILRRERGEWKVFEYDIGISDAILPDWREKRRRFVG